ncbi:MULTISPECIES: hypothetical protein [unclassified Methanosarcina]|uniref:hypothetical protein n=1 Tax=unclassified Methanosarcina TaxID=2644672 RepID=UPI000615D55D|nr:MULTISPECIES: hypothetical protein [unclassified Methanosarcina]AKB18270.1 hypothetical protein MSWHS_1407 [Methanosarcina sp. WWM596]AKB21594.1 hypothetical protein MSWH1_1323 [Methanosarcina sp. WH1]
MNSNTAAKNLGIGLAVIGFLLLLGYGLYNLFTFESSPVLKVSIGAIIAGIMLVLLTLIKEKMSVKDKETKRRY